MTQTSSTRDPLLFHADCQVTEAGARMHTEMGGEYFMGKSLQTNEKPSPQCDDYTSAIPAVLAGRQDRWNPFHVMEVANVWLQW